MPTAITQANIQTAVNAWCSNPTTATATYGHISTWNTVNVTSMANLFLSKLTFNDDISAWNVSNVTTMANIFNGATSFNKPLNSWNVSKVTDMGAAFAGSEAFNQPIGSWNVGAVTTMSYTFCGAKKFNQDLSGWNVSNVTIMSAMFYICAAFNGNITNWNVGKVTAMDFMFAQSPSFNQNIGGWDVRKVTDMNTMLYNASMFQQDLSLWQVPLIAASPFQFSSLTGNSTNPKFTPHWGKFRLTPVGQRYTSVFRNAPYVDAGVSEVYSTIIKTSNVNTAVAGSYTVEYTATAAVTGLSAPSYQIRYVTVVDGTPSSVIFPTSTTSVNRGNVVSITANMLSGTWKYSVNNGSTWVLFNTAISTSSSFIVPDGTYAIGVIQIVCTDSTGNNTVPIANTAAIIIDLVGPVGMVVSIPTSTTPIYRENTVSVTLPPTAASWKYSLNSGSTWTTNPISLLSFALVEGTYIANGIKVACTSAGGNDSAIISNGSVVIIDFTGPYGMVVSFPPSTSFVSEEQTVRVTTLPIDSVTWKYSLNGGNSWTIKDILSTSFILPEATYGANTIQVLCTDSAGNTSATISNSSVIVIDLTGPFGLVVTFPPAIPLPSEIVGRVYITNIPSDATTLKYSVNNGNTWTNLNRTGSSSFFTLMEAVYTTNAIQVVCTDLAGNNSTIVKNTNILTISYRSAHSPAIPVAAIVGSVELNSISTLNLSDTSVIGITVAEQRKFTSSMVKSIFSANTAQNKIVLKRDNILPGFSEALPYDVYLFNVSSLVSNSTSNILTKEDIMSKVVYIVMESGDGITLPTQTSSVYITRNDDNYTMVSGNSTKTFVTGDVYSFDGLRITLGSIFGTLQPPTVNFVLSAMNSSILLSTSSTIPYYSPSFTSDASITLNTSVPASVMQNTFYFRGDSPITTDASFVYYYVDTTKWPNKNTTLSARNGIVTAHEYVNGDTAAKDFLRDLARQLFGTYLGADLFTNEDAVVADINSKFDTVADNIITLLLSIDKTGGIFNGITADLSGNKYLKDDTSISNISRELLNELISTAPERFVDLKTNYKYNATDDGFYKMPIIAGDTVSFKLTVVPASNQRESVPTIGPTLLNNRTYTVIMNIS
jgi:surface protein